MVASRTPLIEQQDVRNTPLASQAMSLSVENRINLPRVGSILRIEAEVTITYDVTAVTEEEDSVAGLFSNIQVRDGQGNTYFAANTGRELQQLSNFTARNPDYWPSQPLGTTVATSQVATVNFVLDFQDSPIPGGQRELDPIAAILTRVPGAELEELDLIMTLGPASVLAATGSYDNVTVSVRLTPVLILAKTPSWARLLGQTVAKPQFRSISQTYTDAVAAFGQDRQLPSGILLSKTVIIVLDNASPAVRSDAIITELQYLNNLAATVKWQKNFANYQRELQAAGYISPASTFPVGVSLVNWEDVVGLGGLNRKNRGENDDLLQFTIGAAGSAAFLHKGYSTYPPAIFAPFRQAASGLSR